MSTKVELEAKLAQLETQIEGTSFNAQKHKDETRSTIALFVVKWYFYLMGIILVGSPVFNLFVGHVQGDMQLILSVKDLISTLSGATSGIFGFVIGYYFKGTENN